MVHSHNQSADEYVGKQLARVPRSSSRLAQEMQNEVDTLMQRDVNGELQAYVVMALHPDNGITVKTSRGTKTRFLLRAAHERSAGVGQTEEDESDVVTQYTTVNDPSPVPPARVQRIPLKDFKDKKDWMVYTPFRIDDFESVVKTIASCAFNLQQSTLRRILKQWIKGICPRKQSKFPYRSQKPDKAGKEVAIPQWWPSEDLAIFREPDHIGKFERTELTAHLAVLLPSPEDLKAWNVEKSKQPTFIKTHEEGGWVDFLKELAPISIVDDMAPYDTEKAQRRRELLTTLYEVASLWEQYVDDAIDGNMMVQPLRNDLQEAGARRGGKKRARQPSASSSTADDEKSDSDDAYAQSAAKRSKTAAGVQVTADAELAKQRPKVAASTRATRKVANSLRSSTKQMTAFQPDFKPNVPCTEHQALPFPSYEANLPSRHRQNMGSGATTPLNTSFGSSMSDVGSAVPPPSPLSDTTTAGPAFAYTPHSRTQNSIPVHQAHDIYHPQFDTMPNTPTFSPVDMVPFEHQHPGLRRDMATLSIDMPGPGPQHVMSTPQHQAPLQPVHGLPSQHAHDQYKQWPPMQHPETPYYEVHHGVPSTQTQHAGFAVGPPPDHQGWATNFHPRPHFHGDHDMSYTNMSCGPSHETPAAALPSSVVRGFTGHASGVGDSQRPPGTYFQRLITSSDSYDQTTL